MSVNITFDKDQNIVQSVIYAFQCKLTRRIRSVFPSTSVSIYKEAITGVKLMGGKDSDRETLDSIFREFEKTKTGANGSNLSFIPWLKAQGCFSK